MHDAACLCFICQLSWRPGSNWTATLTRRRTGQIEDLDNLLGSKGIWRTRTRCIGQNRCDGSTQVVQIGFGSRQPCLSSSPAATPLANGFGCAAELLGEWFVALACGRSQHDTDAQGQRLWAGVLTHERIENRLLGRRECNC